MTATSNPTSPAAASARPRTYPPVALQLAAALPLCPAPRLVGLDGLRVTRVPAAASKPTAPAPVESASESAPRSPSADASKDTPAEFMLTAERLAAAARKLGLTVPRFQSPPRTDELGRSITRLASGGYVVAVRVSGRPFCAVLADAIEGVVAANALEACDATAVRDELWRAAVRSPEPAAERAAGSGVEANAASAEEPTDEPVAVCA